MQSASCAEKFSVIYFGSSQALIFFTPALHTFKYNIYVCVCVCVYMCLCVYICVCVCIYIYIYMCIYLCVYIYIYVYVCMYVYMYMYIYVCICVQFTEWSPFVFMLFRHFFTCVCQIEFSAFLEDTKAEARTLQRWAQTLSERSFPLIKDGFCLWEPLQCRTASTALSVVATSAEQCLFTQPFSNRVKAQLGLCVSLLWS